jgi:hypothetical protein
MKMKKLLTKKYAVICLVGGLFFTGCTKDFLEINTNPSSYTPANYDPNFLLTTAQLMYTGSRDNGYEVWRANLGGASSMMQHMSAVTADWPGDKYVQNEAYTAAYWGTAVAGAYIEQVNPIVEAMRFTEGKERYKNLHQISRIMRAMILQRITDLYGDVPYFNAGEGLYSQVYFPAYDEQQKIYAHLLKEIEEATNALDPAGELPPGDLYFNGDVEKWKRFGNTLLLRTAMRLTKVAPETAKEFVLKVSGKTMQSNSDNAMVKHDAAGGLVTVNRFSLLFGLSDIALNVRYSDTFINFLQSKNDPRLPILAQLGNGDRTPINQKGMPNGWDRLGGARNITNAPGFTGMMNYSFVTAPFLRLEAPTFALTYAESELLLADAAKRWNIAGSAADHYNKGVKAAITQYSVFGADATISDTDAAAYLTAHPYVDAKGLEMINTQFWAATLFNGYEAWNNWRRTGYPILKPVEYPGNLTNNTIPRRLTYPLLEATGNPVNYSKARESVPGGDNLTGRVWWDIAN